MVFHDTEAGAASRGDAIDANFPIDEDSSQTARMLVCVRETK
jgi:hypothetical protein